MNGEKMTCKAQMKALGCAVLIPTYNNAGTIAGVIEDVKKFAFDIIVVNDGSTDGTSSVLSSVGGIKVIGYARNQGKGYALKLGMRMAFEWGYRYVITIDSDGQHFADDIPVFIENIMRTPDSLLIGARNLTADNMPSKNTFANKFSNFWFKVETGQTLSDTQSGFRLYPLEKLHDVRFITGKYEFEVEVTVRAAWRGVTVINVPIKVWYPPEGERISHFRPLRDFTRISILNTVLVLYSMLFWHPWKFIRSLTPSNIKDFIMRNVVCSGDSCMRMAASMGWGVFCGIIPIWGYQMVFAGVSAHFMRLNKIVAMAFSNISIPPMIPFILYGSMAAGSFVLNTDNIFSLEEISADTVGESLGQYLAGSLALAAAAGIAVFVMGLVTITSFKHIRRR